MPASDTRQQKPSRLDVPEGAKLTLDDGVGFIALVDRMEQNAALKVVNSARISYRTRKEELDENDRVLAKWLWENEHTSPYRHAFFTFHWKAPLFVFRQAFKYQVGSTWREYEVDGESVRLEVFDFYFDDDKGCSWNETSGRYVKWAPEFYVPLRMRANPTHGSKQASVELSDSFDHELEREQMIAECEETFRLYRERLDRGVAKEIARMALPQNVYTQAYWTVSLQGVIHFLHQRLHSDAQYEIRRYAEAIYETVGDDLERIGLSRESILG